MHGGSHKQHNATQRYQCARHCTASNHLIQYFIVGKNAFVVAERVEDALRVRLRQEWARQVGDKTRLSEKVVHSTGCAGRTPAAGR
jgi:formylmethanofuran dehydrogenase subunit E